MNFSEKVRPVSIWPLGAKGCIFNLDGCSREEHNLRIQEVFWGWVENRDIVPHLLALNLSLGNNDKGQLCVLDGNGDETRDVNSVGELVYRAYMTPNLRVDFDRLKLGVRE